MLSLGLGSIESFPFLEPPDPRAIADGWQQLGELGAVDAHRKLTAIGTTMAKLPVDVKLARMLVAAHAHGVLREMLVIASFLGIQDPRERPADARAAADAAHAQFADAKSEFVGILKLWRGLPRCARGTDPVAAAQVGRSQFPRLPAPARVVGAAPAAEAAVRRAVGGKAGFTFRGK